MESTSTSIPTTSVLIAIRTRVRIVAYWVELVLRLVILLAATVMEEVRTGAFLAGAMPG